MKQARISINTLNKIENGEPGVCIGNIASVFEAIGLDIPFGNIADWKTDTVGQMPEEARLPQRVRIPKKKVREQEN